MKAEKEVTGIRLILAVGLLLLTAFLTVNALLWMAIYIWNDVASERELGLLEFLGRTTLLLVVFFALYESKDILNAKAMNVIASIIDGRPQYKVKVTIRKL